MQSQIPDIISIEQESNRVGNREMDLELGKQGIGAIVTLVKHKTHIILRKQLFLKTQPIKTAAIIGC